MKKNSILASAALAALGMVSAAGAQVTPLNFDGGNGTSQVDQFRGTAGSGWLTGWTNSGSGTVSVVNANPVEEGAGNYLLAQLTGTDRNVMRRYGSEGDFNLAVPHTISWDFRLDGTFAGLDNPATVNANDRINFFADGAPASASTTITNAWTIGVAPYHMGHSNWYFHDRNLNDTFGPANAINTGIPLRTGVTYSFSVTLDPAQKKYSATVSDGASSFTQAGLDFRNPSAGYDYLHFGEKVSSTSLRRDYSLDSVVITGGEGDPPPPPLYVPPTVDGFKGYWYSIGQENGQYGPKYAGGMATYPQQVSPIAIYSEAADKTFFVFNGRDAASNSLKNMIAYYDHATGQVIRPRMLREPGTDAHRASTLTLDDDGYVWVFMLAHGDTGSAKAYKSAQPYSIDAFEEIALPLGVFPGSAGDVEISYGNLHHVPGQGFMLIHSNYDNDRATTIATSPDGRTWTNAGVLADFGRHYHVSTRHEDTIGVIFNYNVVDDRTNLYYLQSDNLGQSWQTVDGSIVGPLTSKSAARVALIHDYEAEGKLVYLKDVNYDAAGNPVILYLTQLDGGAANNGHLAGPAYGRRQLHVAHWTGLEWALHDVTTTDHNYDFGSLYIEPDGTWRIIGPFLDGPQAWGTGGEVGVWTSLDLGATWSLAGQLTSDGPYNHTYVRRPVNAHDDFYALWADGDAFTASPSSLYFTNKDGTGIWRLPTAMSGEFATPDYIAVPEPGAAAGLLGLLLLVRRRR